MNGLKRCPFCGGEAAIDTVKTAFEKRARYRVYCQNPECRVSMDWDWWSEDDAVRAWNRRAINPPTNREGR